MWKWYDLQMYWVINITCLCQDFWYYMWRLFALHRHSNIMYFDAGVFRYFICWNARSEMTVTCSWSTVKPACNRTARDEYFSVAGKFCCNRYLKLGSLRLHILGIVKVFHWRQVSVMPRFCSRQVLMYFFFALSTSRWCRTTWNLIPLKNMVYCSFYGEGLYKLYMLVSECC